MKRLAIITTHPIQYNAPWFELLAQSKRLTVKVFYTWGQSIKGGNFDAGFGKVIQWDIPLLKGYDYTFVENTSASPGSHHFKGIVNPGLNKEVATWQPDAILIFGWSFQSHLNCIRYFHKKVPVLFRGDSTLLDEKSGIKRAVRRIFLKWVYRHIDIALYAGTNNKVYFTTHGLRDQQLVFAPHAIDNNRFADPHGELARQAKAWRTKLGYCEDDIVVLFAGKLEPKKNPEILLELAKKITNNKIKFLLVGNGEMEQQLKEKAANMRSVKFLDFQNQSVMPVVYRLGNIFILPSSGPGETWGLALNEAMACGIPVIASDKVGGAIDLIKPGVNGFIFKTGNVQELYSQLSGSIDPLKLIAMGNQSKEIIRLWSFEHILHAIHAIFYSGVRVEMTD
ncbi:glycosyltransferase family 4 protein [Pseudoflavitalea sp. X16]|uniref:glycosyltransferase family 4 protein n=1 Tax=Paraflavitalea devenefica TaxID=2716334 RepID=UPI00141F97D4|nr:glycosyltransferase family 4 protein [Paraflavitalea devenefica]NII24080.1 glycosyltransferase family 4 protein [Paraflavitalea devenefica]